MSLYVVGKRYTCTATRAAMRRIVCTQSDAIDYPVSEKKMMLIILLTRYVFLLIRRPIALSFICYVLITHLQLNYCVQTLI